MALRVTQYLSVITALVVSSLGGGRALAAAPDWPWVAWTTRVLRHPDIAAEGFKARNLAGGMLSRAHASSFWES